MNINDRSISLIKFYFLYIFAIYICCVIYNLHPLIFYLTDRKLKDVSTLLEYTVQFIKQLPKSRVDILLAEMSFCQNNKKKEWGWQKAKWQNNKTIRRIKKINSYNSTITLILYSPNYMHSDFILVFSIMFMF